MTIALSPVRRKLQTAASMPTVPEPAISIGSCLVCSSQRRPSCTSRRHSVNGGERWYSIGRAIACSTLSGTGVGPAVSKYSFMARACRLDGGSCSITTTPPRQSCPRVALQFLRRDVRVSGHRDPRRRVAADPPRRPAGAARAERRGQVDGAALARRATCSWTRATCACSAARPSPTCASRRSCPARARCSTRCSSRSRTAAPARAAHRHRGRAARGRPGDAGALRRDAGALPEPGRLRAGGAGQAADDRRRLRRVGPRAFGRDAVGRRARPAGAGEGAGAEARSAAARRADQPPGSGRDRTPGGLPLRVHRRVPAGVARPRVHPRASAARSSSSRTASSSATRSATTSTSSSATRGSNARAPPTSARRSTSTRRRTSSAATWPARRRSRPRAGARCSRSWSGWSAPTTSGNTRARSRCRSRRAAISAARRRSARPS